MTHNFDTDLFEIEDSSQYSGSYTDTIMTGSIFDSTIAYTTFSGPPSTGRRSIGENSVGSNFLTLLSSSYRDALASGYLSGIPVPGTQGSEYGLIASIFHGHQKNRMCGLNFRFLSTECKNEAYHDSLVPDPFLIFKFNGGKFIFSNMEASKYVDCFAASGSGDGPNQDDFFGTGQNTKLIFAFNDTKVTASNDNSQISDNTWLNSTPFERRYKNIKILTSRPTITDTVIGCEYITASSGIPIEMRYHSNNNPLSETTPFQIRESEINIEYIVPSGTSAGVVSSTAKLHKTVHEIFGYPVGPAVTFSGSRAVGLTNYPNSFNGQIGDSFNKCFFGFGDGIRNIPTFDIDLNDHSGSAFYYRGASPVIRGWKYGLYNANPNFTKAVFLRNKFGQIRHMLEQRKYTKFYNLVPDDINDKRGPTVSVVTITFVSGTNSHVLSNFISNATGTLDGTVDSNESGIYDFEYKSRKYFQDI